MVDLQAELGLDIENPQDGIVVSYILWDADTNMDVSVMPELYEMRRQRQLIGTNITSILHASDENNEDKVFFTFPDVSVRPPGRNRINFKLWKLDLMRQRPESRIPSRLQSLAISSMFLLRGNLAVGVV